MSWQHFHFVCRKAKHIVDSGKTPQSSIEEAINCDEVKHYAKANPKNKMASIVLDKIKGMDQDSAFKTLDIYGKLNFDKLIVNWDFLQQRIGYFCVLLVMYFTTSYIFMKKILPVYNELNSTQNDIISSLTTWFTLHYQQLNAALIVFLLLLIILNFYVQKLLTFDKNLTEKRFFKILPFKQLKISIGRLLHYLQVPILKDKSLKIDQFIMENAHQELTILIEYEANNVQKSLLRISSAISTAAYILLVGCITLYITSAYLPIFLLGNIV